MVADPSMFSSLDIQQTPCGNCSVRLQHFIAYVHGAANMTTLAGPAPYSNYALHACKLRAFNNQVFMLVPQSTSSCSPNLVLGQVSVSSAVRRARSECWCTT